jgi:poly(3-hydroxybutyrate) depolymerase
MTTCHSSDVRRSRTFLPVASLVVARAMLAALPRCAIAASGCTPFGNPPQTLISDPVPLCVGGTRLGPWNDSNGTARYACLYTPASASTKNPLPLLVWIHPSLVTADSITSTNTVGSLNHIEWPLTWTEPMLNFLATQN